MGYLYFYENEYVSNPIYAFDGVHICTDRYCSIDKAKYTIEKKGKIVYIYKGSNTFSYPLYTFDGKFVFAGKNETGEKLYTISGNKIYRGSYDYGRPIYFINDHIGGLSYVKGEPDKERLNVDKVIYDSNSTQSKKKEHNTGSSFYDNETDKFYQGIIDASVNPIIKICAVLALICAPFITLYLSFKDLDSFINFWGSAICGTIIGNFIIVRKNDFTRLLIWSWFTSSIFIILFSIFDAYTGYGLSGFSIILMSIFAPIMILGHSIICTTIIYFLQKKIFRCNLSTLKYSKLMSIIIIILISLIMIYNNQQLHIRQRLEEMKEYGSSFPDSQRSKQIDITDNFFLVNIIPETKINLDYYFTRSRPSASWEENAQMPHNSSAGAPLLHESDGPA